jgi:hypothetical protein
LYGISIRVFDSHDQGNVHIFGEEPYFDIALINTTASPHFDIVVVVEHQVSSNAPVRQRPFREEDDAANTSRKRQKKKKDDQGERENEKGRQREKKNSPEVRAKETQKRNARRKKETKEQRERRLRADAESHRRQRAQEDETQRRKRLDAVLARKNSRQVSKKELEKQRDARKFSVAFAKIQRHSDEVAFSVIPELPGASSDVIQAAELFYKTIYLPWQHCDCCGANRRKDKLSPPSQSQLSLHHLVLEAGQSLSDKRLCSKCKAFKRSDARPTCPLHPSNALAVNSQIAELQNLSYMEQYVIRRVHPFQALVIRPQGQEGARGQVIHFPASPDQAISNLLPVNPDSVLLVNYEKPGGKSPFLQLRVKSVIEALTKLQEINHRYRDMQLDSLENVRRSFNQWTQLVAGEDESEELDFQQSVVLDMVGVEEKRTLPMVNSTPLSRSLEYLEADSYPHLFPTGEGDERDPKRAMKLSPREYAAIRLLAYPQFQRDPSWPFRALINVSQSDMSRAVQFVQQQLISANNSHNSASQNQPTITAAQIVHMMDQPDMEATADQIFGQFYRIIGGSIRGTSMYWSKERKHAHAMVASFGPPTFFLTFSADDLHWFDIFRAVDAARFSSEDDVAVLSFGERTQIINSFPAIVSEHIANRFRALLQFLRSPAQPLGGPLREFFFRVEFQKRGTPHFHGLAWIEGAAQPEDGQRYLDFIDSVISAEVPEDDEKLTQLVRMYQKHDHTHTCNLNKRTGSLPEESHQKERGQFEPFFKKNK